MNFNDIEICKSLINNRSMFKCELYIHIHKRKFFVLLFKKRPVKNMFFNSLVDVFNAWAKFCSFFLVNIAFD